MTKIIGAIPSLPSLIFLELPMILENCIFRTVSCTNLFGVFVEAFCWSQGDSNMLLVGRQSVERKTTILPGESEILCQQILDHAHLHHQLRHGCKAFAAAGFLVFVENSRHSL